MLLSDNVTYLKGVGPKRAEALNKAGIFTIHDLLTYFPRAYLDLNQCYTIKSAPLNENICIKAYVGSPAREHYIRKGMTLYKFDLTDGESVIDLVFFNNKYISGILKEGEEYYFYGKITSHNGFRSMTSPKFFKSDEGVKMRPVYPQTSLLNTNYIEKILKAAFESCSEIEEVGSSMIRIFAFAEIALAISTICCFAMGSVRTCAFGSIFCPSFCRASDAIF